MYLDCHDLDDQNAMYGALVTLERSGHNEGSAPLVAEALERARRRHDEPTLLTAACGVLVGAAARLVQDPEEAEAAAELLIMTNDADVGYSVALAEQALWLLHATEDRSGCDGMELAEELAAGVESTVGAATGWVLRAAEFLCALREVFDGLDPLGHVDWRLACHRAFLALVERPVAAARLTAISS